MANLQRWFLFSCGMTFAITAVAKVISAFSSVKLLTIIDPIFGIQFRYLMVMAAVAELIVAYFCMFMNRTRLATALVAWLCTNFLVYRLGLSWMNWRRPCNC